MIDAAEPFNGHVPLDLQTNPFSTTSNPPPVSSAQAALEEVIRLIGLRRRAIIIAGRPGAGKTFLLKMIVRSCADLGLSVCDFDRGDLADPAVGAGSDVVLVDDADSVPDSAVLTLLFPDSGNTATTWVFACLPSSVHRFDCLDATVVELRGLSVDDAQTYLLERATGIGRPDLFAADALDLIVHQARGSPRLLLSIASLAFFTAAWGGATQIGVRHVAYWLKSQISSDFAEDGAAPNIAVLGSESASHSKVTPTAYRPVRGLIGGRRRVMALRPKRFPLARALRSNGKTAAIAASIGLVGAVVAFFIVGNDAGVGMSATVPIVPNQVVAEASLAQTPAALPVSPDIATNTGGDVAVSTSLDSPTGKAAAALGNRDKNPVGRPRAATKRTSSPAPVKTARSARAPKSAGSPATTKKAAQRARDAVYAARQPDDAARRVAQAALQAQHAARQANDAADRAERAARRAEQAASQAERAARLANWGIRLQFPWKTMGAPRSAS